MQKYKVKLLPYQARLLKSTKPYLALVGGTGAGKTWFLSRWLLAKMYKYPGHEWIVSSPTYNMLRREPWSKTKAFFRGIGLEFRENRADMVMEVPDYQAVIYFISAEKPERMQGTHAKGIIGDEAGLYTEEWWDTAVQRVGYHAGQILLLTTPYSATHWLKTKVVDPWLAGDPRYHVERPRTMDNPFYPREEIERARRSLPTWRFRMMYYGEFTRPEGLVYPEVNYVDPFEIPPDWIRIRGVDFGFNNPTAVVWLAKDPQTERWYVYQSLKKTGMLTENLVEILKADGPDIPTYCDPAGKTEIATLQRYGVDARSASNAVLPGILHVTSLFKSQRLFVFNNLLALRDEFEQYHWRKDRKGTELDEVVKEHDHLMDALRYALFTYESQEVKVRDIEPDVDFSNVQPTPEDLELLF